MNDLMNEWISISGLHEVREISCHWNYFLQIIWVLSERKVDRWPTGMAMWESMLLGERSKTP